MFFSCPKHPYSWLLRNHTGPTPGPYTELPADITASENPSCLHITLVAPGRRLLKKRFWKIVPQIPLIRSSTLPAWGTGESLSLSSGARGKK